MALGRYAPSAHLPAIPTNLPSSKPSFPWCYGPPFATKAVAGLSQLSVWWIRLGINHERIQAGHPEQNGRHERMHRTLKQDLRPAHDWRAQQRELDRFRNDYNHIRPHEALDMQTPASVYLHSPRPYPARMPEFEYPDNMQVRTVRSQGHFKWKNKDIFLTHLLWGEPIGLLPIGNNLFNIYFNQRPLVGFDPSRSKLVPLNHPTWPTQKNKNPPDKEKLSGM